MRGIYVDIYRAARPADCTAGGVTSPTHDVARAEKRGSVVLFGVERGNVSVEDLRDGDVALVVVRRTLSDGSEYLHAEPLNTVGGLGTLYRPPQGKPMAGGNFVYTSDSRFPSMQPISVHDRWER